MKRDWKLICVDVDGTLLDDTKKVPKEAADSLRAAAAAGVWIALVSGRMPAALAPVEKELGISCIKACCAGTYILMDGQCLSSVYLPAGSMRAIGVLGAKRGIPLWIYREEDWFVTGEDALVREESAIIGREPKIASVEELARAWDLAGTGPNKLLFGADPKAVGEIGRELKSGSYGEVEAARSADMYLEIYPKGMNKGRALNIICEKLNIDSSQAIAFGDQELDIPMIEAAGLGVAMGNAIEELKEKADYVTGTNNEAGIAQALGRYLNP